METVLVERLESDPEACQVILGAFTDAMKRGFPQVGQVLYISLIGLVLFGVFCSFCVPQRCLV